jgi:ribonuclease HII
MIENTTETLLPINNLSIKDEDSIWIGGIDEAGRGSIIGPLVVAGIVIHKSKITLLRKMRVRDSKVLTAKTRTSLFNKIIEVADSSYIFKINPIEIDENVLLKNLNKLEAKVMAGIINNMKVDKVYVDCCDVNPHRYKEYLEQHLTHNPRICSLHHADAINVVVSAASIIAKVIRDEEIRQIRVKHDDIGSGYPSDPLTMKFIKQWIAKNDNPPEFARKSWKPLRSIMEQKTQFRL